MPFCKQDRYYYNLHFLNELTLEYKHIIYTTVLEYKVAGGALKYSSTINIYLIHA